MAKGTCFWLSTICGGIIFLVLLILLVTSFVYVEYDELAFKKSTVTNTVDQSEVYDVGRYVWGPDHTKVVFPSQYQLMELKLGVSNAEGVTITIDISFLYKLRVDTLSQMYSKYGLNYEGQIQSISRAVIRNTAVTFSVDDFLSGRRDVTASIAHNVSQLLAESVFVDVPEHTVQLNNVQFTESILQTHLAAAIRLEENEKKEFEQSASLIRSDTEKEVQQYTANTTIILRTAEANKTAKIEGAQAKYEEIIGAARGDGLAKTIKLLGMDDDIHQNVTDDFLKLMAILDNNKTQIVNLDSAAIVNLNQI